MSEEHIIIGRDRHITVPEALQRIAVQYDHNAETVTFDCPRYWDEHDLSTMNIYINYSRSDNIKGKYLVKNLTIDETDSDIIHFDWTIQKVITLVIGPLAFLVCATKTDVDGNEELHWNSEINKEMSVSEGLECDDIIDKYPDIITDLLTRIDQLETDYTETDPTVPSHVKSITEEDINNWNNKSESGDITTETDPTVPSHVKSITEDDINNWNNKSEFGGIPNSEIDIICI